MAGRRFKLTKELIREIETYISNGMTNLDTCNALGISESIFYKWQQDARIHLKEGRKDSLEMELLESLKKAASKFKTFHIQQITKASNKDWKASAWMLERRYPEEFARRDRLEVAAEQPTKINITFGDKSNRDNYREEDPIIVDGGALKSDIDGD